jgi:hypothetical protein
VRVVVQSDFRWNCGSVPSSMLNAGGIVCVFSIFFVIVGGIV